MKWISVKDRLPYEWKRIDSTITVSEPVLVYFNSGNMKVNYFINGQMFGSPTHWMPMPAPPSKDKG